VFQQMRISSLPPTGATFGLAMEVSFNSNAIQKYRIMLVSCAVSLKSLFKFIRRIAPTIFFIYLNLNWYISVLSVLVCDRSYTVAMFCTCLLLGLSRPASYGG
jgi:hypothetical protein